MMKREKRAVRITDDATPTSSPLLPGTHSPVSAAVEPGSGKRMTAKGAASGAATAQHSTAYHRLVIDGDDGEKDFAKCADTIAKCMLARHRYKSIDEGEPEDDATGESDLISGVLRDLTESGVTLEKSGLLTMVDGIYTVRGMLTKPVDWKQYIADVKLIFGAVENGPCLSTARSRLITLEEKFELYALMNTELEEEVDRFRRGGGVYAQHTRVDCNVSLATLPTAPQLVEFLTGVASEAQHAPFWRDTRPSTNTSSASSSTTPPGSASLLSPSSRRSTSDSQLDANHAPVLTLRETLDALGMRDPAALTVDGLGLHPPLYRNRFQPYDVFNELLNPAGLASSTLLNALMDVEGPNKGELFAQLVRPMLERAEFADGQTVAFDMKIPIWGRHSKEWQHRAHWVHRQGFNQFSRVMWSVMIRRESSEADKAKYQCTTYADQLKHLFYPMFMATLNPYHPDSVDIATMLHKVGQIVIVPETQGRQKNFILEAMPPSQIPWSESVDDYYFFYYVWANLCTLNALRRRVGQNTIQLRIACVENFPGFDQLVSSYLLADAVEHALSLSRSWILQYLFLMSRVGVIMSPLCDNALRVSYFEHPFGSFFKRGLHVALATSDPLHFHHSLTPLTEEYATMMKLAAMTPMDLCEIARNSVLISNFSLDMKREWLGDGFQPIGSHGNDITRSSLCDYRLHFRHECLLHEQSILNMMLAQAAKPGGPQPTVMTTIPPISAEEEHHRQLAPPPKSTEMDSRLVFPRIEVRTAPLGGHGASAKHLASAAESIRRAVALRKKYSHTQVVDVNVEDVFKVSKFDESIYEYNHYYGVYLLSRIGKPSPWPAFIPTVSEFMNDMYTIRQTVVGDAGVIQLAAHRLDLLEHRFLLHLSMNIAKEGGRMEEKEMNNRDFFTARKVDNNIQTESGMNARTLIDFFAEKAQNNGDDVVFEEGNMPVTLRQLLERLHVDATRITVDELNHLIKADAQFRDIFLSTDNFMQGRYFAELTKRTLDLYQLDEYTFSENRLTIFGKSRQEWWNLAHWFDRYGMASSQNRWMINIPRNYRRLRQQGIVKNFGEFIDHIFQPLWEISLHPASDTKFHSFLTHVSGFDCIDDESKVDLPMSGIYPHDWSSELNPPYNMYLYYIWANIVSLNEFRASRGLGRFTFRPQSGEQGDVDHLIGAFLLANSVNHGVTLHSHPAMEYLYYLTQIGIAMSPLSNTKEASPYLKNPFPLFFHRGLNVSLSTNQPHYFHFTREPLIEEYSIAAKIWKMEFNDLSEIARNSVLQSGFPPAWKERALGKLHDLRSPLGNDVTKSRLSDVRVAYRFETYHNEMNFLDEWLPEKSKMARAMRRLSEEIAIYESVKRVRVIMPGQEGSAGGEEDDIKSVLRRLRIEVDSLARDLHGSKLAEVQLTSLNHSVANRVQTLRERFRTMPLSILGNVGSAASPSHTDPGPASPPRASSKSPS